MSIEVRAQTDGDQAAVRDVLSAAFGDQGEVADLADALRARTDTGASLVAIDDGGIVGHVQLSISWLDAPSRLVEVLTLSPLGVAPARQRQGIGRRLLDEAVRAAGRLGAPLVFLEGRPAYYGRLGWRAASDLGFGRPSTRIPAAAFQVMALPSYDPAAMHGAVVYNDTFWSQDGVGLRP